MSCKHERLDEEGICRKCGADMRTGNDMSQDFLETKDFYDLMQAYRHSPATDQLVVLAMFNAVKQYIRDHIKT